MGEEAPGLAAAERATLKLGVLSLVLAFAEASAAAQPSLWQRARDPLAARAERALVRMERVFDGVSQASGDADMMRDFRQGTLLVGEMSGARAFADPRLRVLLAESMLGLEAESDDEVQALLAQALSLLEPSDAWLEAEIRALMALSSRRDAAQAQALLTRALVWVWQPSLRSVLLRSRANARMALSDVRGSLRDARAAQAVAEGSTQRALSGAALALALERSGDQPAAFAELRHVRLLAAKSSAESASPPMSFVFRAADGHYVAALREMELAASVDDDAGEQLEHLDAALFAWRHYERSVATDDPWLGAARAHLRQCERARRALVKTLP